MTADVIITSLFVFALTKLDYIWRRIHAFMDPAGNDVAYQTNQSVIAIGSAPAAVRLRQASATACLPPSTGPAPQ